MQFAKICCFFNPRIVTLLHMCFENEESDLREIFMTSALFYSPPPHIKRRHVA